MASIRNEGMGAIYLGLLAASLGCQRLTGAVHDYEHPPVELSARTLMEGHGGEDSAEPGDLGATVRPVDASVTTEAGGAGEASASAHLYGALVTSVRSGGPAAAAGIEVGDVIVQLGGQSLHDGDDLLRMVARMAPGRVVDLQILREGEPLEVAATLDAAPER